MNALHVIQWMQKYPGLIAMVGKLPNFDSEAANLLMEFMKKVASSPDPEGSLKYHLKKALREPEVVRAEVVSSRPLPRR